MSLKAGVEYLTVLAAASYLGVSRDKLSRMIRAGQIETLPNPLDGRQRLIDKSQLDALKPAGRIITDIEQLQSAPPPTPPHEKDRSGKKKKKNQSKLDIRY